MWAIVFSAQNKGGFMEVTLLTVAEVASLTRRHAETVTKALRLGELKGSQRTKRGRWLVRMEDAVAWATGS